MPYWVYMLRCADDSYYVGHTDDLTVRLAQHEQGAFAGYTASRRPVTLVWQDELPTRDDAFAIERQLKGWSRRKKEALIRGDWSTIRRAARRRGGRRA